MNARHLWRLLLASLTITVLAMIFHGFDALFAMDFYTDPTLAGLWSKIMMPHSGLSPTSFMYYSFGFNFITALLFAIVFWIVRSGVPGRSNVRKGFIYGFLAILIASIPAALAMILILNIPLGLVGLWTLEDVFIKLLGGGVLGGILK